jgi:hypothetical protein
MSNYELREKIYEIEEGKSVDDVCDMIKSLAGLPFAMETILITKSHLKVQVWTLVNTEPPHGELPIEDPGSLSELLQQVELREVESHDVGLNLGALAVIADMLLQGRAQELAGVAWIVGSVEEFCRWLGIKRQPIRFLELPVVPYSELPDCRVVLLCAKSAQNHVFQSRFGIATNIPMEGTDADV